MQYDLPHIVPACIADLAELATLPYTCSFLNITLRAERNAHANPAVEGREPICEQVVLPRKARFHSPDHGSTLHLGERVHVKADLEGSAGHAVVTDIAGWVI